MRSHLPASHTKIFKIHQKDLKAFAKLDEVERVVAHAQYRVTYPAVYTCVMDAKYDALELALKLNDTSEYMAWCDIGMFR